MDTGAEIRDAVKIVLQQMREHPEDFKDRSCSFGWLYDADPTQLGLNAAETEAFSAALADLRYRRFHDSVLNSMLEEQHEVVGIEHFAQAMVRQGSSLKPNKLLISPDQIAIAKKILGKTA